MGPQCFGSVTVQDLDSANGTTVGGVPAVGPTPVPANGCFEIGSTQIQWIPLDRVSHRWRRAPPCLRS